MTFYNMALQFFCFLSQVVAFYNKTLQCRGFFRYAVTFYNKNFQIFVLKLMFFSLHDDNKYFQICEFL